MKNIYHRINYLNRIKKSLKKEKLVLLYWQRQVWKTTLMRILENDNSIKWKKYYFSFEDTQERYFKNKNDFIDFLSFETNLDFKKNNVLFLDEVQYVDNIVWHLKSLYDDDKINTKIVATWSWMWNLPTTSWSSLVWRWDEINVYQFSFNEFMWIKWKNENILDYDTYSTYKWELIIDLYNEYLTWWWYPEVIKSKNELGKQNELEKITKRYFEKDVIFWFNKDEIVDFRKIFYYIYQNIWNLLKIEKISDITWVWVKKISNYISFLKKSMVIYEISPFFNDKSKEIFSHWKMYISDLWLLSFMWKNYWSKLHDWKIIENYVFLEIIKNNPLIETKYYKKKNWTEIDFIIENRNGEIIPIEVKSSNSLTTPKIFYWFNKNYNKIIKKFIKTTKNIKEINNKELEVLLIPNFLIWNHKLF